MTRRIKARWLTMGLSGVLWWGGVALAATSTVSFPGAKGEGYPVVDTVQATLQTPDGVPGPWPAVAIFHGSGGIDGRGAFHAQALNKAGIATLEVLMFSGGQRPRGGHTTTLSHAYGALLYLSKHPDIVPDKIGAMGFSWGGNLSLRAASKAVHKRFFPEGQPRFAAHAPFYAVWWSHTQVATEPTATGFGDYAELTGAPVMLFAGGQDDFGAPNDAEVFLKALPEPARAVTTLQFYPDATHGWDSPPAGHRTLHDPTAHGGKGGRVRFWPNAKVAEDSRQKGVAFFKQVLGGRAP